MTLEEMVAEFRRLETEIDLFKLPKVKSYGEDAPSGALYTPLPKVELMVQRQAVAFAIARELSQVVLVRQRRRNPTK